VTPKLELRGIVVRRGGATTLEVESLAVEPGEVLAVIGPNGAGKSTLLQVAALLLPPTAGDVLFEGETVRGRELSVRRRMAVALQDALLLGGSIQDNVALGLSLRGESGTHKRERAAFWLRRFGIEALARRPAGRVSGGEARRASLARAFALEPEVLLLDEPFSGLDEPTRHALLDDLAGILAETGVTAVFVTHDRDEALRVGGRVAVVIGGRLRQAGPPGEVFGAPADEEVGAFVGVENILDGRVLSVADGLAEVEVAGRRLSAVAKAEAGGAVRVCLRPEDVVLSTAREALSGSARNHLAGVVVDVRPRGAEARVVVDCGFPLVATVTRRSAEELELVPGRVVVAACKATAVHLLTGGRSRG
jgi:tungstate transport system ATP-binding protein